MRSRRRRAETHVDRERLARLVLGGSDKVVWQIDWLGGEAFEVCACEGEFCVRHGGLLYIVDWREEMGLRAEVRTSGVNADAYSSCPALEPLRVRRNFLAGSGARRFLRPATARSLYRNSQQQQIVKHGFPDHQRTSLIPAIGMDAR